MRGLRLAAEVAGVPDKAGPAGAGSVLLAAAATAPVPVGPGPSGTALASPWSTGTLTTIVWADVIGDAAADFLPIDRALALSVPACARAVGIVTGALSRLPLQAFRGTEEIDTPTWAYSTAGQLHPGQRMRHTVEDLILAGWSLWKRTNGADRTITAMDWLPPHLWMFDSEGRICDDVGQPFEADEVCLFEGPHDGILSTGKRTLRGAISIERAWTKAAKNPTPTTLIHAVDDTPRTDAEVKQLLTDWRTARSDPEGAVAYLPASLALETPGQAVDAEVLEGARNAAAVDIARLVGLPSVSIDAGPPLSSLTYTNVQAVSGVQAPLIGLQAYADAISWRLSMDDITPRGTRIVLDAEGVYVPLFRPNEGTETRD